MLYARVLVHFAEKILTINKLKRSPPKRLEVLTALFELNLLSICNQLNYVAFIQAAQIRKALPNTVARSGAGDHKLHFAEIQQSAVI